MRMDRRRTEIAGRNVPVESGEIITIDFSGGPQPGDAGPKDFWVIFNERDAYIARWRHGEDPGERFRIMENEKGYERAWGGGSYCDWHPASDKARSHKVAEGPPRRRSSRRGLSDRQPDYADRADEQRHPIRNGPSFVVITVVNAGGG